MVWEFYAVEWSWNPCILNFFCISYTICKIGNIKLFNSKLIQSKIKENLLNKISLYLLWKKRQNIYYASLYFGLETWSFHVALSCPVNHFVAIFGHQTSAFHQSPMWFQNIRVTTFATMPAKMSIFKVLFSKDDLK